MHVEIVAPALLAGPAEPRMPSIELLLARGRASRTDPAGVESWLAQAFGLSAAPLPAGALTALARGSDPGGDVWLRADPVHLRLQRDSLALIPSAGFAISIEEAAAIVASVNDHFKDSFSLIASSPDQWCLHARGDVSLASKSPLELAGKDVNANLPTGDDAARWHAALNEVQMLLHEHPVNEGREVPVNSLWFWGAGRLPGEATGPWQSVTADDPVLLGLAQVAQMRHRPLPASAGEWLERNPQDGRHLLLLERLRAAQALGDFESHAARLRAMEENWFAPLAAALRSGRIGMLSVRVPEAGLSFETTRADLRRFWRRPRPLGSLDA